MSYSTAHDVQSDPAELVPRLRLITLLVAALLALGLLFLAVLAALPYRHPSVASYNPFLISEPWDLGSLVRWAAPKSLLLAGMAFALAFALALGLTAAVQALHRRMEKAGRFWPIVAGLGSLAGTALSSLPAFVLALALAWSFGYSQNLLPVLGEYYIDLGLSLTSFLKMLILPVCALAGPPAGLAVTDALQAMRASSRPGPRRALGEVAGLLASLFHGTGNLFSSLVLVELIFNRPGLGQLTIASLFESPARLFNYYGEPYLGSWSWPAVGRLSEASLCVVFIFLLVSFILLVLAGRTLGMLFDGLARWARTGAESARPQAWVGKRTARVRLLVCVGLLLAILGTALAARLHPADAFRTDLAARLQEPSPAHPLGADRLGRDVWVSLQVGTAVTFGEAGLAAGGTLLLAGWLLRHRKWLRTLIAALLLLPADALLCLPSLLLAILLWGLSVMAGLQLDWTLTGLLVALVLLPQATLEIATTWAALSQGLTMHRLAACMGSCLISLLLAGFGTIACLNFIGLGSPPLTPRWAACCSISWTGFHSTPAGPLWQQEPCSGQSYSC